MPAPNEPQDGDRPVSEDSASESEMIEETEEGFSLDQLTQAFADAMGGQESPPDAIPPDDDLPEDGARGDDREQSVPGPEARDVTSATDDRDRGAVTPRSIVEAIMFVGHPQDEPISSQSIANLLRGVDTHEVDQLVVELNESYQAETYPYRIASVGPGYQMQLCDEFDGVRQRFYGRVRQARLSQAAIDVLAVVAYNQPISRDDVEKLRGAKSGPLLTQLVRRGLLEVQASPEKPRQKTYRTTERFLALFGLESLEALPRSDEPD